MKRETKQQRANIVNKALYYIYQNIATNITLEELAKLNSVSKYHFHRIFKEETKQNLFDFITSTRLQKAATLLITNKYSTISEIALLCGYSSHSSFIKAFKAKYNFTPTKWRKDGHKEYSKHLIGKNKNFENVAYKIIKTPKRYCAYIRHKGYDKSIFKTWQRLKAYAIENNLDKYKQYKEIAFHHDNPTITNIHSCSYVAAIEIPKDFTSKIATFEVEPTLCAVFNLKGEYGDVLSFLRYVYHFWLPQSGFEANTTPSHVIYHKNHFLNGFKDFDLDFYLPLTVAY